MKFTPLATGSTGNLYTLDDGKTKIIIEPGIAYKKMQKLLGFDLRSFAGVLVSHSHKDHSSAVPDLIKRGGLAVYMSECTKYAILGDKKHHRAKVISVGSIYDIGSFKVIPFPILHDAVSPLGFAIKGSDGDVLIFATDTGLMPNLEIKGLTQIAIECNYDLDSLDRNKLNGSLNEVTYKRIKDNHMGLDDVLAYLDRTDISNVKEIYLLHHSRNNCDIEMCVKKVGAVTGITTKYFDG